MFSSSTEVCTQNSQLYQGKCSTQTPPKTVPQAVQHPSSEQILTNDSDSTRAPNNVRSSCSWLEGSWLASHLNHIESHSGPTQFLSTVRIRTRKRTSLPFSTYEPLFARRVLHNISNVHSMFQTQWKAFATIMAYVRPKNLALQASSSNAFICTPCICQSVSKTFQNINRTHGKLHL